MIGLLLVSSLVMPPFIGWLIYTNVDDQRDEYGEIIQPADEAREEVLHDMLKCPIAIIYYIWVIIFLFIMTY